MKDSIRRKLEKLDERFEEISRLLSDAGVIGRQNQFRELSMEYARLGPLVDRYRRFVALEGDAAIAHELAEDSDPATKNLGEEELAELNPRILGEELELQRLLVPKDPHDDSNIFLEVRAGTGGDEAALFAGDLFRMYAKYAERRRWKVEILSTSEGTAGGFKEIVAEVSGRDVFARLKFESGVHRVQRVPATETQGRIHTSAATVAVLPIAEEADFVINEADLKIDTYRSSGAGGQHVNKTESAIRITHLPTGVVVAMQEERSQHRNRTKAMALLRSRILDARNQKLEAERAQERRSQVGSGDRSQRIRTYNFPQGRVTDHRINLTLYSLDRIMDGEGLDDVVDALTAERQAELLAAQTVT